MAQLLAPQSMETLDTWGSIDALDAFGNLEALDSIELFETTASVDIAITQVAVAGEIFSTTGASSIAITAQGGVVANVVDIAGNASISTTVSGASCERLRTVASAVDVGIVSQGGLVGYQLGATASVSISFVKSATIEVIEHVVGSASIAITQTATPYRIQHIDAIYFADELKILIQIFPICTPNYTAVFASTESISVTNQAEFFVTYAFDATSQIQITNSLTGEILGERWIPVSNSTNNVWHIR